MKKQLLLSVTLISGMAMGQSFTSANDPAIGVTQPMFLCDTAAISMASNNGAGAIWDYSNLNKMDNGDKTYSVLANDNTTDFAASNKMIEISDALKTYIETTATQKDVIGFEYAAGGILGDIKIVFDSDKLNLMNYDFKLNDEISDIFSGTVTHGAGTSAASGNSYSTVDAIGTLKLSPTVTKTDVTRHHMVDTINTTVLIFNVQIIFDQFDYYDFTADNLPLFTFLNVTILQDGAELSNINFVLNTVEPVGIVSIDENTIPDFKVFPNPAKSTVQIAGIELSNKENIHVLDLTGKKLISQTNTTELDVTSLSSGIYIVEIEKEGKVYQEKFIKE